MKFTVSQDGIEQPFDAGDQVFDILIHVHLFHSAVFLSNNYNRCNLISSNL